MKYITEKITSQNGTLGSSLLHGKELYTSDNTTSLLDIASAQTCLPHNWKTWMQLCQFTGHSHSELKLSRYIIPQPTRVMPWALYIKTSAKTRHKRSISVLFDN